MAQTDLALFDYDLPEALIAQHPLHRREQARLLVVDRTQQTITHDVFANLDCYLPDKSVLVVNNSRVIAARLLTRRATGAEAEIFLLRKLSDGYSYETLMRPLKRLKEGEILYFAGGVQAEIIDKTRMIARFNRKDVMRILKKIGHIPLPPYIRRDDQAEDRKYYQTVYAQKDGSVAAPTAGLHFTNRLISKLQKQGHDFESVTLHVGYGTFKPVEEKDVRDHQMHIEEYEVADTVWKRIKDVKASGRKVVAIGTTSCRVIESIARGKPLIGATDIFLYPGCDFKMTDVLVTNFHLPKSTLLMLVYAFGGIDLMRRAYHEAIKEKYRFYSYGDGMVIL